MTLTRPIEKVLVNGNALGGSYAFAFHRLLGDLDGNGVIEAADGNVISRAASDFIHSRFWWYCDLDGDGYIGMYDSYVIDDRLGDSVGSYNRCHVRWPIHHIGQVRRRKQDGRRKQDAIRFDDVNGGAFAVSLALLEQCDPGRWTQ